MRWWLTVAAVLLLGCTPGVRYSPGEIQAYPPHIREHIRAGQVTPGMSPQQVRYAWGAPSEVEVLEPSREGQSREAWTYKKLLFRTTVIFTGGVVTEIISTSPGARKYIIPREKP
jgi:hypothetical protein